MIIYLFNIIYLFPNKLKHVEPGYTECWIAASLDDFLQLDQGHSNKNSAGQVLSHLRTCYFGEYWADYSGTRSFGMPAGILARESPMSDRCQSIFSNVFFLVEKVVPEMILMVGLNIICVLYLWFFDFEVVSLFLGISFM